MGKPVPKGAKNPPVRRKELVRCLGPNMKEHMFLTAHKSKERICANCRRKQDDANVAMRWGECRTRDWSEYL